MATMTIRIPDAKQERLRRLAEQQGISVNRLVEQWANVAIAQHDAEIRFRSMAARGNARRGIALLNKIDRALAKKRT